MKRFIYILLAGLAAAGLASCDKQDLKPSSDKDAKDVYTVVIEEDLQTKVSASFMVNEEHTFHATLKKNGTPVNCSSFDWTYPGTLVTQVASGSEPNKDGVTVGYLKVKGTKMGTGEVYATTDKDNTGGNQVTSNIVTCDITASPINSITLTLASSKVTVTESTTYTVTANYSDGTTRDVTKDAKVSASGKGVTCSGGNITTSKVNGCFEQQELIASYEQKQDTKTFTIESDFISCAVYGSCYGVNDSAGWEQTEHCINGTDRAFDFVPNPRVAGPNVGSQFGLKVTRIVTNAKYSPAECTFVFSNNGVIKTWDGSNDKETIRIYYYGKLVQTIDFKYTIL